MRQLSRNARLSGLHVLVPRIGRFLLELRGGRVRRPAQDEDRRGAPDDAAEYASISHHEVHGGSGGDRQNIREDGMEAEQPHVERREGQVAAD